MRRKRGGRRVTVGCGRRDAELRRFSTTGRRAAGRRAVVLLANHRAKSDIMSGFLGMFLSF